MSKKLRKDTKSLRNRLLLVLEVAYFFQLNSIFPFEANQFPLKAFVGKSERCFYLNLKILCNSSSQKNDDISTGNKTADFASVFS